MCTCREKLDAKAGQKRKRAGRETAYECGKCGKSLCVTPCFELYHTHLDYENAYIMLKCNNEQWQWQ